MSFSTVKKKAQSLFKEASYLQQIKTTGEYEQALALMDELVEDYENQKPLIELLARIIHMKSIFDHHGPPELSVGNFSTRI